MTGGKERALWFGVHGKPYEGSEPAFFDDSAFAWAVELRKAFPVIREALRPLMTDDSADLKPYFDTALQYPPRNWKTIGFYFWGKKDHRNLARFRLIDARERAAPPGDADIVELADAADPVEPLRIEPRRSLDSLFRGFEVVALPADRGGVH